MTELDLILMLFRIVRLIITYQLRIMSRIGQWQDYEALKPTLDSIITTIPALEKVVEQQQ